MIVVKVQIPLVTNDPHAPALIYDRNRKHQVLQKLDAKTREQMGSSVKAFFRAEWDGEEWKIGRRMAFEFW